MAAIAAGGEQTVTDEDREELLLCARYGEVEDLTALLEKGVSANHASSTQMTPLHYACANGHLECVRVLQRFGAVSSPNVSNNYPLHWAVQSQHVEVVQELLASNDPGVDILVQNGFGKSALTEAFSRENGDLVKMLLTHSSAAALEKGKKSKKSGESKRGRRSKAAKKAAATPPPQQQKSVERDADSQASKDTEPTPSADASSNAASKDAVGAGAAGDSTVSTSESKGDASGGDAVITEPGDALVTQRIIHAFKFGDQDASNVKLVRVQEVAIDWQGASFSDNDASKDVTGLYVWSASIILSRWITDTMSAAMQGRSICELGAGAGLPGIAAAAYCGAESVLLTDLFETTVDNLNRNIEMNKNVLTTSVTAKAVDWNDADTWPSHKFGVVLGSDLVYCQEMVPSLITMVAAMLAEDGVFLYVAPDQRDGLVDFVQAMQNLGFVLRSRQVAPPAYHENPLYEVTQTKCDKHFGDLKKKEFTLYEWRRS